MFGQPLKFKSRGLKIWGSQMDLSPPFDSIFRELDLLHVDLPASGNEWVAHIPITELHLSVHGLDLLQKLASSIECNQRSLSTSYLQWFAQYSAVFILGCCAFLHPNHEISKGWLLGLESLLTKFPKDL